MPECFYRASIVSEEMDFRQKHAGMTVIDTKIIWHFMNLMNYKVRETVLINALNQYLTLFLC